MGNKPYLINKRLSINHPDGSGNCFMKCPTCKQEITGIREICPQCGDSVSFSNDPVIRSTQSSLFIELYYSWKAISSVLFTLLRYGFYNQDYWGNLFGLLGLICAIFALVDITLNKDRLFGKSLAIGSLISLFIFYAIFL